MMQKNLLFGLTFGSVIILAFFFHALQGKPPLIHIKGAAIGPLVYNESHQLPVNDSDGFKNSSAHMVESFNMLGYLLMNDTTKLKKIYAELFETFPTSFSPRFKNPCWFNKRSKLRCLPYFYQIGMPKCGTTDLWNKLIKHPQIQNVPKEPHWWAKRRNGWTQTPIHAPQVLRVRHMTGKEDDASLEWYLNWFEAFAVQDIKKNHKLVFGDGSVTTSFTPLGHWRTDFPGAKDPPVSLPDLMHSLQPEAKIIVILREPVSRFYSAHLYNGGRNSRSFDRAVKDSLECMATCLSRHTDRFCAYQQTCDQIFRGMYSIYMTDWIKAYGHDKVHVIRLDEWVTTPIEEYKKLLKFLEIDMLSNNTIKSIVEQKVQNSQKKKMKKAGEMLPSSRKLLEDFYRPYNRALAELLNDTNFLWDYG
ncbi:Carbohydrate sulfotransferase 15 [Holothuria leucospilota]|uniref:Carbohydrate sulfotransferase 15 n=1 Tax=Holothuria leucospilota TaxID=206669 RepID=A0A9Q1HEM9_HOLLE|nr:Carbohydrate sulfotransferase 15 [Holothuria leucospilota]